MSDGSSLPLQDDGCCIIIIGGGKTIMILRGPNKKLMLDIASDPDEVGWCKIILALDTPEGYWKSHKVSCLLVDEIEEISEWMLSISEGKPVDDTLKFIEDALVFQFIEEDEPRIRLCMNPWFFRPPWVRHDDNDEYFVEFPFVEFPAEPKQLARASKELMESLKKRS